MKELQPINQNVLLDISEQEKEQKTSGGIIIPDTAREKPSMARVVGLSNIENAEVSIGDTVLLKSPQEQRRNLRGKNIYSSPMLTCWPRS